MTGQQLVNWLAAAGALDAEIKLIHTEGETEQDFTVQEFELTGDGSSHHTLGAKRSHEFHITIKRDGE